MAFHSGQGVIVPSDVSSTGPFLIMGNGPVRETPDEDDDHIIRGRE